MPKKPTLDSHELDLRLAAASRRGAAKSEELCKALAISQAAFSRHLRQTSLPVYRWGKARQTCYALLRVISGVPLEIPVFSLDEQGNVQKMGTLLPMEPQGFCFLWQQSSEHQFFQALPFFLDAMRPRGFLGRLLPMIYPQLVVPRDIMRWTDDDTLRYWFHYGWNLPGHILVGEKAVESYLRQSDIEVISLAQRASSYTRLAEEVLHHGVPGGSAAGEQPKFLAYVEDETWVILNLPTDKSGGF